VDWVGLFNVVFVGVVFGFVREVVGVFVVYFYVSVSSSADGC